jgi:hypothetical protein
MHLIEGDDSRRRLKPLLYSWANPEKAKGRRLAKGQLVERVGPACAPNLNRVHIKGARL